MKMTDKTTNMLVDTLNDLEEPFSPVMELTAKSVTGCLTNVLQSAAGAGNSDSSLPSPEVRLIKVSARMVVKELQ